MKIGTDGEVTAADHRLTSHCLETTGLGRGTRGVMTQGQTLWEVIAGCRYVAMLLRWCRRWSLLAPGHMVIRVCLGAQIVHVPIVVLSDSISILVTCSFTWVVTVATSLSRV